MNVFDIIILSAVALSALGAIVYLVRLRKKGKSVCCGDCTKCGTDCSKRIK